jgi:HSP20 family molecular chaperone IbpA
VKELSRRENQPLAELFDWFEGGWPALADWRRGASSMRIEDRLEDDRYVVRAELPGVDPDKDVQIEVRNGQLIVSAERREELSEKGRSEFRYGSFRRRVSLPPGAQEDAVSARYQDGILEITVPIAAEKGQSRSIPVIRGGGDTASAGGDTASAEDTSGSST